VIFHGAIINKIIESHKYTLLTQEEEKFIPNMTGDVNRMEVRKNWDMLMPRKSPLSLTVSRSIH
jgi:hypothetical protein